MKYLLEVNNKTPQKAAKKNFLSVLKNTLKLAAPLWLESKTVELSIALVSEAEIQLLNRQYRKKDAPTDVLSFSEYEILGEMEEQNPAEKRETVFLGEIILCPTYIARNAEEDGETFEYALNYITSHGILHLMGLAHGKKMFAWQRAVADQLLGEEKTKG